MSNEPSKSPKSYRTAGILFLVGGLIFTIVSAISSKMGAFLTPGIALVIVGIALWQHSGKLANAVREKQIDS